APAGALGADPKQGHPTATATGAGSRSVCRALGSWAIGSTPSQGGDNRAKTRCDPNAGSSFCVIAGVKWDTTAGAKMVLPHFRCNLDTGRRIFLESREP